MSDGVENPMQMKWMRDCLHWDWALRETERAMVSHTDTHKSSLSRSLGWWFREKRDWNVKECEWQRERERGIVVFIGGGVCSMCLLSVICLFMAVLTKVLFSISICELNLK